MAGLVEAKIDLRLQRRRHIEMIEGIDGRAKRRYDVKIAICREDVQGRVRDQRQRQVLRRLHRELTVVLEVPPAGILDLLIGTRPVEQRRVVP